MVLPGFDMDAGELLDQINKEKENLKKKFIFFFSIFISVHSPVSGKENVRFPDSSNFENFPDLRAGRDVR
jgi:hypothetical protein